MPKEIERKFLVDFDKLTENGPLMFGRKITQFYLVANKDIAVRLRSSSQGTVLTIKHGGDGMTTNEEEFAVSHVSYVTRVQDKIGREIIKTRYIVTFEKRRWEIDIFEDDLDGLIVAELECPDAADVKNLPPWVTREVTYDYRFKNAVLATSDEWKDAISEG